jgi:hypothetical protein
VSVLTSKKGCVRIGTYLAKNSCTVAISCRTFSRDRFLSRYNVCIMSLNGSQMGSTAHASVNGIDIAESLGDGN